MGGHGIECINSHSFLIQKFVIWATKLMKMFIAFSRVAFFWINIKFIKNRGSVLKTINTLYFFVVGNNWSRTSDFLGDQCESAPRSALSLARWTWRIQRRFSYQGVSLYEQTNSLAGIYDFFSKTICFIVCFNDSLALNTPISTLESN